MSNEEISKLDRMIRDALTSEDRQVLEETRELGYFALGLSQFSGKLGWITWVIMIVQSAMFIIGAWCGYHFFIAVEVLPALKWGFTSTVLLLLAAQLKLSLWPQMQADRVIREIKRVELILASRMKQDDRV